MLNPRNGIEEIYSTFLSNWHNRRASSSLAQRMESWLHKQVASDVVDNSKSSGSTLELGAGSLNQLKYEPKAQVYDVVEPFNNLYKKNLPFLERVGKIYSDIAEVPINYRYDRITSIATLEHLCNLPEVIAKSGLLLNENGSFRAAIPSEGTFLWKLGWKITTGLEFNINLIEY
jgi:hypothetical protein